MNALFVTTPTTTNYLVAAEQSEAALGLNDFEKTGKSFFGRR